MLGSGPEAVRKERTMLFFSSDIFNAVFGKVFVL